MALVTLREILQDAAVKKYGVGMFNTINLEMVRAIIGAAEEERSPVIIGLAEVHIPYGALEMLAPIMVKAAAEASVPVAVHFDHGMTFDLIVKAMKLGFTSVMYDGSMLSLCENIKNSAEIVRIAKAMGVSVEAELGHVGGAEGGGEDGAAEMYTNVEQAARFVAETGIDALAVAIGTAHGEYRVKPCLDIQRLRNIHNLVEVPLVLHGGSGLSDQDFRDCIKNGISKVNIFTDMSVAAIRTIRSSILTEKDKASISYPNLINMTVNGIKEEIISKMRLFESSNKA